METTSIVWQDSDCLKSFSAQERQERQETQVRPLSQEGPLENAMVSPFDILAWKIPWTLGPGRLPSTGMKRVRRNLSSEPHSHWNGIHILLGRMMNKLVLARYLRPSNQQATW